MKKGKVLSIGKFTIRNRPVRKVGLDTDNCFSWMENEKEIWNYKPKIAKRGNLLYINYVVFGELMSLLAKKYPNKIERKNNIFKFLKRNKILGIKPKDVNESSINQIFTQLTKLCS